MAKGLVLLGNKNSLDGTVISVSSIVMIMGEIVVVEGCYCEYDCRVISSLPDGIIG